MEERKKKEVAAAAKKSEGRSDGYGSYMHGG